MHPSFIIALGATVERDYAAEPDIGFGSILVFIAPGAALQEVPYIFP